MGVMSHTCTHHKVSATEEIAVHHDVLFIYILRVNLWM